MAAWNPRANSIFLSARELPPGERASYLAAACQGDAVLRDEVLTLLAAEERAGSFLEASASSSPLGENGNPLAVATPRPRRIENVGDRVGPYKLLEEIGEGGMGLVYLAEQSEPVRRTVALKIIKPGMDARQVVARFEAERQALALMDHPHIAKVLDGGATAAGLPYFVMELVKGPPLTKYCDERQLTLEERLKLFIPVCQAVQHAHQKGIIHRDLKPSNVLAALYDGRPVPKVIDFGVAKATGQRLTERTMFTAFGTVIGTLEYMSPEQAELNQLDVDTRSDVYSLGVLLYELTTGSTPLEAERAKSATFDEARRIIREEPPPKPSTRLASSANLPALAAQRGLEPRKLAERVRGDLDWIVMKALEKDRNRRYETADALARDLERFLANEPIEARPPSTRYQVSKFVARNRSLVTAATIVVAALTAGIVASSWQAMRAMRAEQAALKSANSAQAATTAERAARQDEARQRRNAERLSRSLVKLMVEMLPEVGRSPAAVSLLQSAEDLEESVRDYPDIHESLAKAIALTYFDLRLYEPAAVRCRKWLEAATAPNEMFAARMHLAHSLLRIGETDEGAKHLKEMFEKRLNRVFGEDADQLRELWAGLPQVGPGQRHVAGRLGLALDGDADYVFVPDLQFDGRPPWTLEAIIRPTEIDQYSDPNGNRWTSVVSATDGGSIGLETNAGKWALDLYVADAQNDDWTANYATAFARAPIRLNEWQHLAGVWDGAELRIYVDGELQGTKTGVETCTVLSEGPFLIGADPADWNLSDVAQGYFHGVIRSVRISHGVEYAEPFKAPERLRVTPETLALYDFTVDTGRYAVDRSGHGRHGIIVGAKFVQKESGVGDRGPGDGNPGAE